MTRQASATMFKGWLVALDIFCALVAAYLLITCQADDATPQARAQLPAVSVDQAIQRVAELRKQIAELEARLNALLDQGGGTENDEIQEAVEKLRAAIEARREELQRLEQRLHHLRQAQENAEDADVRGSLEDLKGKVAALRKELDRLTAEETALRHPEEGTGRPGVRQAEWRDDLNPRYIVLVKSRVVPIAEPYYKFSGVLLRTPSGGVTQGIEVTREKDGQPVHQASKPGGCLAKVLADADPKKHYIRFFVCADSLDAFWAAAREVRRRGFRYNWTTYDDKPLVARSGGSGNDGPEGVF